VRQSTHSHSTFPLCNGEHHGMKVTMKCGHGCPRMPSSPSPMNAHGCHHLHRTAAGELQFWHSAMGPLTCNRLTPVMEPEVRLQCGHLNFVCILGCKATRCPLRHEVASCFRCQNAFSVSLRATQRSPPASASHTQSQRRQRSSSHQRRPMTDSCKQCRF